MALYERSELKASRKGGFYKYVLRMNLTKEVCSRISNGSDSVQEEEQNFKTF